MPTKIICRTKDRNTVQGFLVAAPVSTKVCSNIPACPFRALSTPGRAFGTNCSRQATSGYLTDFTAFGAAVITCAVPAAGFEGGLLLFSTKFCQNTSMGLATK